ncbi:MAG: hypothetical protein M1819_006735 [Sarea resinae]|nr:MAG: hypothetical protein M1819_006735 [Sarea resinae]
MTLTEIVRSQDAFSLYHRTQEAHGPALVGGGEALPALGHAVAGSIGSAISSISVYPLSLMITRLQVQRQHRQKEKSSSSSSENAEGGENDEEEEYRSIQDAAQKIYAREGGLSAFYAGVAQDTGKTITDSFLFFLAYNFLRQQRQQQRSRSAANLSIVDELGVGILAGAISRFITMPMSQVVTRKQTSAMVASRSRPASTTAHPDLSTRDMMLQIRADKGLAGFWAGYSATLILTLNPSLTFLFYESFKKILLPKSQRDSPSARATFLLAAVSKALASAITYPFSLAKARAQTLKAETNPPTDPTLPHDDLPATTTPKGEKQEADAEEGEEDYETIKLKASLSSISPSSPSSSTTDTIHTASHKARSFIHSTIFFSIYQIARTDGLGALYEGLGGEVLKGFLGHGITMLVKEQIHVLIVRLYISVLRLARSAASRARARAADAQNATATAQRKTAAVASSTYEAGRSSAGAATETAKDALDRGQANATAALSRGKEGAGDTADFVADYVGEKTEELGQVLQGLGAGLKQKDYSKDSTDWKKE